MQPDAIKLWVFPASDFDAWCRLTGNDRTKIATHADYMVMLTAIQADQERQGQTVVRVGMLVADMIAKLCDRAMDNTPENRALVVASEPAMKHWPEAIFEFGVSRVDGQPISDLDCSELLELIINWAADRGLAIGGGFHPGCRNSPTE